MFEPHEQSPEILAVLVNAMVFGLDVLLLQKADHGLLQLSTSLTGNYLNDGNLLLHRFIYDVVQGLVYLPALVEDLV